MLFPKELFCCCRLFMLCCYCWSVGFFFLYIYFLLNISVCFILKDDDGLRIMTAAMIPWIPEMWSQALLNQWQGLCNYPHAFSFPLCSFASCHLTLWIPNGLHTESWTMIKFEVRKQKARMWWETDEQMTVQFSNISCNLQNGFSTNGFLWPDFLVWVYCWGNSCTWI